MYAGTKSLFGCLISLVVVSAIILWVQPPSKEVSPVVPRVKTKSAYGDCSMFYLDVGSNIGVQVRKLFEPSRYPGAAVLPVFDEYFGRERHRNKNICAIGLEMNPSHTARLVALERHYTDTCGYTVHFFTETAAGSSDGQVDFWTDNDVSHNEWGASINMPEPIRKSGAKRTVRSFDLARFLVEEVLPFASVVVMKLDIEGTEYDIVLRLVATGALCNVDFVFMDLHPLMASKQQQEVYIKALSLLEGGVGCRVKISTIDDESFLHDADNSISTC